jgi:hypothetical protein
MLKEQVTSAEDSRDDLGDRLDREAKALIALLRIEADKVSNSSSTADVPNVVIEPLIRYATARKAPADDAALASYRSSFGFTYSNNPTGHWVPQRLALGSGSLAENQPILAGLTRLKSLAGETVRTQLDTVSRIGKLQTDLDDFRKREVKMDAIASGTLDDDKIKELLDSVRALGDLKASIDAQTKAEAGTVAVVENKLSMSVAYDQLVTASKQQSSANFQLLRDAVKPYLAHPTARLFKEVDDTLAQSGENLSKQIENSFDEKQRADLKALDSYLNDFGDGRRIYAVRYETYRQAAAALDGKDSTDNLIGGRWASYAAVQKAIEDVRGQLPKTKERIAPAGASAPPFDETCKALLKAAEEKRLAVILDSYINQTRAAFEANVWSPYVEGVRRGSAKEMQTASELFTKWQGDMIAPGFGAIKSDNKVKLALFVADIDKMKASNEAFIEYAKKFESLRVSVRLTNPGALKWHTVSGGGNSANIFRGEGFSTTVKYGSGGLGLSFNDPTNGRNGSARIDTSRTGPQTVRVGDDTLTFEVQLQGEVPKQPSGGLKKTEVLQKLR